MDPLWSVIILPDFLISLHIGGSYVTIHCKCDATRFNNFFKATIIHRRPSQVNRRVSQGITFIATAQSHLSGRLVWAELQARINQSYWHQSMEYVASAAGLRHSAIVTTASIEFS